MEIKEIKVSECNPFRDNPFKVRDDLDMEMLVQSIKDNGVMVPIMVRPQIEIGYEIISGHRRVYACKKAGVDKIPAFIQQLNRDEAVIRMVDSNLHRDSLLPSEKAFAYKMKLEALDHRGQRSGQLGHKSRDDVSDTESGRTVQRYIRLTNLESKLLDLVDQGRIALTPAVELSYLLPEEQKSVVRFYESDEITPSYSQSVRMRKLSEIGLLSEDKIFEILSEIKGNQREFLKLPMERYDRYLGRFGTAKEKENFILKALDHYTKYLDRQCSLER